MDRETIRVLLYSSLPGGSASKESTCNVGNLGLIPELGRSPGERKGYPLQYSGLENPMDSIVHGVTKSWTQQSNCYLSWDMEYYSLRSHGLYSPWNSPGQNTAVGSLSLLQGIFPTQGSNPDLPHCRQILYHLGHRGRPRTLEWVAYPFSRGSSRLRNRTRISCIARGFFTSWATRQAKLEHRFRNHAVKV